MIDVKEAVRRAKREINEVFADEDVSDLGLEEVRLDESAGVWKVTLGFARPWRNPKGPLSHIAPGISQRDFKVVSLDAGDGHLISIAERRLLEHG